MQRGMVEVEGWKLTKKSAISAVKISRRVAVDQPSFHPTAIMPRGDVICGVDCKDDECGVGERRIRDGDATAAANKCKAAEMVLAVKRSEQHAQTR